MCLLNIADPVYIYIEDMFSQIYDSQFKHISHREASSCLILNDCIVESVPLLLEDSAWRVSPVASSCLDGRLGCLCGICYTSDG